MMHWMWSRLAIVILLLLLCKPDDDEMLRS